MPTNALAPADFANALDGRLNSFLNRFSGVLTKHALAVSTAMKGAAMLGAQGGVGGSNRQVDRQTAMVIAQNSQAVNRLTDAIQTLAGRIKPQRGSNPAHPGAISPGSVDGSPGSKAATKVGDSLASAFDQGRAGILSLVSAADPSAFSTFNASLTAVSIQVGQVFVPYVMYASQQLQALASWFGNLDDSTKLWIGRVGMAVVAVGGAVVAFRTLAAVIGTVRLAMQAMGLAAAIATPVGGAIALVSVLGGLAAAWYGVNQAAKLAGDAQANAAKVDVNSEGTLTPAQLEKLPQQVQNDYRSATSAQQRREVLNRHNATQADKGITNSDIKRLPVDVQMKLAKPGISVTETQKVLQEYEKNLTDELTQLQGGQIGDLAKLRKAQERFNETLKDEVSGLEKFYDDAVKGFEKRTGKKIEKANGPDAFILSDEFDEYNKNRAATMKRLIGAGGNLNLPDVNPLTLQKAFPTNRLGKPEPFQPLKLSGVLPGLVDVISNLEEKISFTKNLSTKAGTKPGMDSTFAENIKWPTQSRYSGFAEFGESVQLAALNQGDQDSKNLADVMKNLEKRIGDAQGALEKFLNGAGRNTGAAMPWDTSWFTNR